MSDRVAKSDPDINGKAKQSMNHYQAAWLDHWRRTSHKSSVEIHSHLLHHHEPKKDGYHDSRQHHSLSGPEVATDIAKYAQGFREVSESKTTDDMKKSMKMGSMKGKEILDRNPFPMFTDSGNRESAMSSTNYASTSLNAAEALKYQMDLNDVRTSFSVGKFQPEGISRISEQLVKSHEFLERNSLAVSTSFLDAVGSSSKIVPHELVTGVAPKQSFTSQHHNCYLSNPVIASEQHFTDAKFRSYSTFRIHEEKAGALPESRKLGSSLSMQNDAPPLLHDQSRNISRLQSFSDKQSQKAENMSSIRLLPNSAGKEYDGHFLMPRIPCSVHDVKTMRISTNIDSVEELPRGPSKFSQTTHEFYITKKTGFNLIGGQASRDALISPKLKGNMFNEFLSLSPGIGFHGQQGVKLQPLESSTDSEGKHNVGDVRTSNFRLKDESSVETDTMELDHFQKSQLSSLALRPPDQNIKGVHDSSLSESENVIREARNKMANTDLPDMNEEVLALPAMANSINEGEMSTSRTQSLDAEHLLCRARQPSNSYTTCPDGSQGPGTSSRCVKRLKLSTSDLFGCGTKSPKVGKVSPCEEVNMTFSKILNCSKTRPEPTVGRSHVRPEVATDQTAMVLKNDNSTSSYSVKKSQELSLSHFWIHRWCRQKAASPNKKPDAVVLYEPQSSKATLNELEKKQFPSIAAMAMVGKAMSSFQPCELRRRGSLIVWSA